MANPVRIIYDNSNQIGFPEHKGKVFAVIGPFEGHLDKMDLRKGIERVLIEYNTRIGHGPGDTVRRFSSPVRSRRKGQLVIREKMPFA